MRSRKELIYLNIKDLTSEEIESLSDNELNCCDSCGEIELSEKLNWIDGEDFWDIEELNKAREAGFSALCDGCCEKIVPKEKWLETKTLVGDEIDTVYTALEVTITSYKDCAKKSIPDEAKILEKQIKIMRALQKKLR